MTLDPRLTPARPDLAAAALRGKVEAARFVEPRPARLIAPSAPLLRKPGAAWDTEALHGEAVAVYDTRDGFAWVQLERDGYVGYVEAAALGPARAATHRVTALRTHAYPSANMKLPHLFAMSLGAQVTVVEKSGDFLIDPEGKAYWARHLAPLEAPPAPDFVAVAELFEHCPYLWGGRTSGGIDCSGLAQAAMRAAGIAAPRDSDLQADIGEPVEHGAPLSRGDLVFWKGHVGLMRDGTTLLHANGFHMAVVSEPLAAAKTRIAASGGGEITGIRRL